MGGTVPAAGEHRGTGGTWHKGLVRVEGGVEAALQACLGSNICDYNSFESLSPPCAVL